MICAPAAQAVYVLQTPLVVTGVLEHSSFESHSLMSASAVSIVTVVSLRPRIANTGTGRAGLQLLMVIHPHTGAIAAKMSAASQPSRYVIAPPFEWPLT